MAISPEDIAAFVSSVLAGEGSDADKAATINDAAAQYGVSQADIAAATGFGADVVSSYLGEDSSPLSSVGDAPSGGGALGSADDMQQDAIDTATSGGGALSNIGDTASSDTSFVDNSPLSSVFTGPSPEDLRTAALNAQWEAQQARDTNINTFIQSVLNNPNLDDYQRALAINQSNIGTREEIASATRFNLTDVNKFLDQKPPEEPKPPEPPKEPPKEPLEPAKPPLPDGPPEERPADYVDPTKRDALLESSGDKSRYVFDENKGGYTYVVDTAYWDKQLNQLQTQVNSLAAEGKTPQEIKAQLATTTGSDKVADYLASKTLAPAGKITDNFTAYVTPKTVDGQQYQVLDISKVLNYATQNNLPFATVVKELSAQFPNLKESDLQYEKDRQAVSGFIKTDPNDATKSTLSYTDALTAALQQGVSVDNLAKFFGQTPQQFSQTVKDNLGTFASTLKDAKLDPVTGLKSLLGIEAGDTTKALQEKAIQNDFAAFASGFNKDNPLTYQKLGDYLDQKNISMQQAKDLLGFAPNELAAFRFTPEQRDVRQAYDTYTTQFNKDNPQTIQDLANFATTNKLDAYQAAVALGLSDATTAALNNELKFSPQERSWREAAQTSTTPITFKQASDFQLANKLSDADMERIFGIPTANLEQYRAAIQKQTSDDQAVSSNAIDAVRSQDTVGYYRGAQIPTFTDRYIDRGDEGTTTYTAAQQLTDWQAEQDRRAALTPAQRAIEDARYTIEGEGSPVTAFNTVNIGGKDYTVAYEGGNLVRLSDDQSGLSSKQTRYDILDPATGKITQEIGVKGPSLFQRFLTNPVTGLALGMLLPGVGSAIGSALGATGAAAGALGSGVLNFGLQVAAGADPIDALKGAVLSAGAGFAGAQVSSLLPAELAAAGKNAVTQLITTGKLDPAALATSLGTSFATDALVAETGLDKATAAKLVNAGVKAIQGNELGALTSLFQVGLQNNLLGTSIKPQSPQDRAAFLDANASPLGLSALYPNPTEDELIAFQQRTAGVNQALSDYFSSGSDLSREGLVSQLQRFGMDANRAELVAQNADKEIEMSRVGADVLARYSQIDPEFGGPALARDTALQEMVVAGFSSDRANALLNERDAANASKLENKLAVQGAFYDVVNGSGTVDQLRSAMMLAGYTDAQIKNEVARANAIIEGGKLTPGEKVQERAANLVDIRGEIAGKSSFNEAYATAREKLGSGASFTWNGKTYTTAEPVVTKPSDTATASLGTAYVAPNGMHNRAAFIQAGGGTSAEDYAKYVQAVNSLVSEGKSGTLIKPSSVNSTGKELPSTRGPVLAEVPRVDSVLGSVAAQGVASFGANTIGGALNALGFTNAGAAAINKANQLANAATAAEGADITQGKRQIDSAIDKLAGSSNFQEAATNTGNLFSTIYQNPKAFGATVGSEIVEEILQIGALKFLPVGFWTKELISSATENGGAAYNTEYDKQIKSGASKETAHDAAQKAAGVAAGTTVALAGAAMGLGKVVGKVAGSTADEVTEGALGATKQVGKTTAKESMQEMIEEGSISAAVDMALRDKVDAKNFLVNVIGGGLYGGPTSGSMQATKLDTLDAQSTFIGSGLGADPAAVDRAIGNIQTLYGDDRATSLVGNLVNAENLGAAGQTLANDLSNVMGNDAAVTTANTLVGNLAISQMSDAIESQGIQLDSLSTVVARTDTGNEITLGNALGASITGNGQSLPASTVIGTTLDGTNVTLGQVTSLIKTDTAITNTLTNAQTTTDPNTGITTTVTTNPTTNETVKLSVNPNTNITTQVTTSQNITSTTTVNANTNITTNTTVNTNTNTTTNTAFDAGSGEVVIQVVDNKSGLIVDTKFTSFDLLPADLKASLTVQSPDVKTTTTKPTVKKPIVQPKPVTKPPIQVPVIEDLGRLKGTMLESSGDPRLKDPLAALSQQVEQMNQIDPALLAVMAQRLGMQTPEVPSFTYGEEKSIDEILGKKDDSAESDKDRNYAQGGYVAPLQTMNVQFMNRGGYLGREDFKHGKHVAGEGDGQSDDIPAWLADGEFVFPADVVSALGNGSTKAGTDKLYKMMHEIRAKARSTKVKDLPPPAHKSPLDYIRKGK